MQNVFLLSAPLSEAIDTGREGPICCDVSGYLRRDPNGEGASLRGRNITVQLKFPFDPHEIHSDFKDKLKQMSPSFWFEHVSRLSKTKRLEGVYQLELVVISDRRLDVFSDSVRLPDVRRYYEWLPMQSEERAKEFSEAFVKLLKKNYDPTRWLSLQEKISRGMKLDPDFVELMVQSVVSEEDAALLMGFST